MPSNVRVLVQLALLLVVHGSLVVLVAGKSVPRVIDQDLERYEPLEEEDHRGARVPFNLEETYDQSFRANSFNGTWKTDREILYSDNYVGDIRLFDVTTGSGTVLLDSSVTADFDKASVMFSFDNSHVAIGHDYVNGFRYSIHQKCTVYNIKSRCSSRVAATLEG